MEDLRLQRKEELGLPISRLIWCQQYMFAAVHKLFTMFER